VLDARQSRAGHDSWRVRPGLFEYQYKDLRIATDAYEAFGSPVLLTALAHELYKTIEHNGMGRDDNSGIMQVLKMMAG
jgi:3-hydroxyisobutyrate dehydrogenase-like beta-hydroxyacid dehydrogenase